MAFSTSATLSPMESLPGGADTLPSAAMAAFTSLSAALYFAPLPCIRNFTNSNVSAAL